MDVPISLAVLLALAMSLYESLNGGAEAYFDAAVTLIAEKAAKTGSKKGAAKKTAAKPKAAAAKKPAAKKPAAKKTVAKPTAKKAPAKKTGT